VSEPSSASGSVGNGSAKYQAALEQLEERPKSFEFFQAVRLLERLFPERAGVGDYRPPAEEIVRFSAHPSIAFPPTEIESLRLPDGGDEDSGGQPHMSVNFMGLIGPQGVLPLYYTLLVAEELRNKNPALRDFFDIFQHRMVSLLYKGWEKTRFPVSYERTEDDALTSHVLDITGMGLPGFRRRMGFTDETLVFYAGLLAPQPRSALGLERLLEDYFDVPVEVVQFIGGWYDLPPWDQCALGDDTSPATRLGMGAVAGDEVWDEQARVRLRLGPLTRDQYESFLPTGSAYTALRKLTRFYSHDQLDFEVQLVLKQDEVPGLVVGADAEVPDSLGWATWIRTGPRPPEGDETILSLS
jgi:type VI secretion system protein ImpH